MASEQNTSVQGKGKQSDEQIESERAAAFDAAAPVKFVVWDRATRTMLDATEHAYQARALLAFYGRSRAYMTTV